MHDDHLSMSDLAPADQARKALVHILGRIRNHSAIGYYMGHGTESLALATEALAALTGEPIRSVREAYSPTNPRNPGEAQPSKAPCLTRSEADTLEAVAAHLRKQSGRIELEAGTTCDQCGYERHQVADQLDSWATQLNAISYHKGGAS